MKNKVIFTILLLYTCVAGMCQVQNRFAGWLSTLNSIPLTKRIGFHFDFSLRSTDQWQNIQTLMVRPGMSFRLNKTIASSIGYCHIPNRIMIDKLSGYLSEHPVWQ